MTNKARLLQIESSANEILVVFNDFICRFNMVMGCLSMNEIELFNEDFIFRFSYENRHSRVFDGLLVAFNRNELSCNILDIFEFCNNRNGQTRLDELFEKHIYGLDAYNEITRDCIPGLFDNFSIDICKDLKDFVANKYSFE